MTESELIEAARTGDEGAFGRFVGPHSGGLYAHCYRMLGSPQDAEDALQETLLRAWRGLRRFEARSSSRTWLYTIATNASLRTLQKRGPRTLPLEHGPAAAPGEGPGPPLAEEMWVQPAPDARLGLDAGPASPEARYEQRESVELAFVAALQLLAPRQRAVLIMRDVLGFSAREVASAIETTPAAVDSALQRARATVDARLPRRSQQATLRTLGDERLRVLVGRYLDAWERGDVEQLTAMLSDAATIAMPPMSSWFCGREAVARFLAEWPMEDGRGWACERVGANGQLAFAHYRLDGSDGGRTPHSITVVELDGGQICAMTAYLEEELFGRFVRADT